MIYLIIAIYESHIYLTLKDTLRIFMLCYKCNKLLLLIVIIIVEQRKLSYFNRYCYL